MKVAILGAGCYRTHAASGITNFSRACEVAEATGKENISMTHSTIEMGAELLELAGVDEVVVSDPVFDGEFTVVDDFDYAEVMAAHKAGNPEEVMPAIREKVGKLGVWPLLFNGENYIGTLEECVDMNEVDELKPLLV